MKSGIIKIIIFDSCLIILWYILFVYPIAEVLKAHANMEEFIVPTFLGVFMFISYWLNPFSYISRGLHWFSVKILITNTKFNPLIWGLFLFLFSAESLLSLFLGTKPPSIEEISLINKMYLNPGYWIGLSIIAFVTVMFGLFARNETKKRSL